MISDGIPSQPTALKDFNMPRAVSTTLKGSLSFTIETSLQKECGSQLSSNGSTSNDPCSVAKEKGFTTYAKFVQPSRGTPCVSSSSNLGLLTALSQATFIPTDSAQACS
eukprot:8571334-Karenia_brevis.AAC.1